MKHLGLAPLVVLFLAAGPGRSAAGLGLKSNGERVEQHHGRPVRGPDGQSEIVWYSHEGTRQETFREAVRREGEGVGASLTCRRLDLRLDQIRRPTAVFLVRQVLPAGEG